MPQGASLFQSQIPVPAHTYLPYIENVNMTVLEMKLCFALDVWDTTITNRVIGHGRIRAWRSVPDT